MEGGLLIQIALYVLTAGAVYGGIRADLRHLHEKADAARDSARRAHRRLDQLILGNAPGRRASDDEAV